MTEIFEIADRLVLNKSEPFQGYIKVSAKEQALIEFHKVNDTFDCEKYRQTIFGALPPNAVWQYNTNTWNNNGIKFTFTPTATGEIPDNIKLHLYKGNAGTKKSVGMKTVEVVYVEDVPEEKFILDEDKSPQKLIEEFSTAVIEKFFQCDFCQVKFTKTNAELIPRSLICGHTSCFKCAIAIQMQKDQCRGEECPFKKHPWREEQDPCANIKIMNVSVSNPRNFTMMRAMEKAVQCFNLTQQLKKRNAKPAEVEEDLPTESEKLPSLACDEDSTHEAIYFCDWCKVDLCEECFTKAHTLKVLSTHKKIAISEKPIQLPKCTKHSYNTAEFICEDTTCNTDAKLMCHTCLLVDHKDHKYEILMEKLKENEKTAQDWIDKMKSREREIQGKIDGKKEILKSYNKSNEKFEQKSKEILDYFQEKLTEANEKFEKFVEEKIETLGKEKEELEEGLEKAVSVKKQLELIVKSKNNLHLVEEIGELAKGICEVPVSDKFHVPLELLQMDLIIEPKEFLIDKKKKFRSVLTIHNALERTVLLRLISNFPDKLKLDGKAFCVCHLDAEKRREIALEYIPTNTSPEEILITISTRTETYQVPVRFEKSKNEKKQLEKELNLDAKGAKVDKSSINCEICMENYNSTDRIPRLLISCGHTLCEQCVVSWMKDKVIECPFDRKNTKVEEDVTDLPKNFEILKLLDDWKVEESNKLKSTDAVKKCPNHLKVVARFYCTNPDCSTSSKIMCHECMGDEGAHEGHSYISIKKHQEKLEKVEEILEKVKEKEEKINLEMANSEQQRKFIDEKIKKEAEEIAKQFDVKIELKLKRIEELQKLKKSAEAKIVEFLAEKLVQHQERNDSLQSRMRWLRETKKYIEEKAEKLAMNPEEMNKVLAFFQEIRLLEVTSEPGGSMEEDIRKELGSIFSLTDNMRLRINGNLLKLEPKRNLDSTGS